MPVTRQCFISYYLTYELHIVDFSPGKMNIIFESILTCGLYPPENAKRKTHYTVNFPLLPFGMVSVATTLRTGTCEKMSFDILSRITLA